MKKLLLLGIAIVLFVAPCAFAQTGTTETSTVSVTVAAEAAITVPSNATLTSVGTNFANYTGTTSFLYLIRTTKTGGTGSITLKVTSDFAGTGGPSVGTPPTTGDALTYVPTVSSPGTAATGPLTASTSTATSVGTFGAGANSVKAGNSASVAWTLTNDPVYATGTYTATITWTISAA